MYVFYLWTVWKFNLQGSMILPNKLKVPPRNEIPNSQLLLNALKVLVHILGISALNTTDDQRNQLTKFISEYSDEHALSDAELALNTLFIKGMVNPTSITQFVEKSLNE